MWSLAECPQKHITQGLELYYKDLQVLYWILNISFLHRAESSGARERQDAMGALAYLEQMLSQKRYYRSEIKKG